MEAYEEKEVGKPVETDSLDLTDLAMFFHFDEKVFPSFLLQTGCRRLYVGSYFCPKYFMKSLRFFLQFAEGFLRWSRMRITLVVPVGMGHDQEMMLHALRDNLESRSDLIDELVVNDYGMLTALQDQRSTGLRLIAGRLFFRNYRDPRYGYLPEIAGSILFPSMLAGRVDAADLDLVSSGMDFSEIPEDVEVHIHYPYVYATMTRTCEFASCRVPDAKKFGVMMPCGNSCMNGFFRTKAEGVDYLHLGKGVHTRGPEQADYSRIPDRFVYWPADEFLAAADWQTTKADFGA